MKRLRHPIRAIREPFGTAGLIVACVALVAALAGGAYAASAKLTAQQKKEVKKIAKQVAKPGAPGQPGPAGAAGAKGEPGASGSNGSNGVSPTGSPFAGVKGGCPEGGVEFKGANTTVVCNGVDGETGFTDTLPSGKTETGNWAVNSGGAGGEFITMSFNIPLATAPTEIGIVRENGMEKVYDPETNEEIERDPLFCTGTALAPTAPPGKVCMYTEAEAGVLKYTKAVFEELRLRKSGATVLAFREGPFSVALGTWAVTAE
jgi:hypothetical protein